MEELRKGFHHELDEVRLSLARLAASVIEAIPRATNVLLSGDLEGAEYLILADDEIDSRSIALEDRCYQLLALQAPVAGDLRQLISILKMVGEIERSADLTVNIAKAARRIYGHSLDPKLRGIITKMGEQAQQLFTSALQSFEENDVAIAGAIFESHAAGSIDLQVAIQLAVVARFYERIGDHAVNIGERVLFIVSGWRPENKGAARHDAKTAYDDTYGIPLPNTNTTEG
ncbi:MAG: phosphate transport system regulatory protein [Actinomycetota bacterium]